MTTEEKKQRWMGLCAGCGTEIERQPEIRARTHPNLLPLSLSSACCGLSCRSRNANKSKRSSQPHVKSCITDRGGSPSHPITRVDGHRPANYRRQCRPRNSMAAGGSPHRRERQSNCALALVALRPPRNTADTLPPCWECGMLHRRSSHYYQM